MVMALTAASKKDVSRYIRQPCCTHKIFSIEPTTVSLDSLYVSPMEPSFTLIMALSRPHPVSISKVHDLDVGIYLICTLLTSARRK